MADTKPQAGILPASSSDISASAAASSAAPSAEPPTSSSDVSISTGGIGATTWVNGKKINALWAINENRNSWVGVAGVGWIKLANNSDTAVVALTIAGANAKLTQGTVNYRQESDAMLHEIYVW